MEDSTMTITIKKGETLVDAITGLLVDDELVHQEDVADRLAEILGARPSLAHVAVGDALDELAGYLLEIAQDRATVEIERREADRRVDVRDWERERI